MKLSLTLALVASAVGLQVGISAPHCQQRGCTPAMQMQSWNPLDNLKQMADQRIAKVSHCMLAAGTDLSLEDAYKKIDEWKAVVGNDEAKFIELAKRESECPLTAATGGEIGIIARGKLGSQALDDLIFQEDVKPVANGGTGGVVRGPVATKLEGSKPGLSLVYVHTCWEPMQTGVVVTRARIQPKINTSLLHARLRSPVPHGYYRV